MLNHKRFQPQIAGPTCDHCRKPLLICGATPCKGMLDDLADRWLREEMQQRKPKPVPLIKGGQGRRRDEVESYANTICILAFVCVVVAGLMAWGMR